MIPTLHKSDERLFSTIGFGGLGDAKRIRVKWQLNGMYELEMQYPLFGRRHQDLQLRRIILAGVGPDEEEQPFRIYRITAPLLGVCMVYARHIAYDLMGYTLRPFSAASLSAALTAMQSGAAVQAHGFTFGADFTRETACAVATPRSVWSMLGGQEGSVLDVYGGEWDFDYFRAILRQRIGADNGVRVSYGKNLQTLEQDENLANTWTAVQPYWISTDGLTVVTLPEATVSAGEFDYTRVLVLDLSAEFQEPPTEEDLRSRTKRYISSNKVGIPEVGLDVQFVPLDQTEEFKDRNFLTKIRKGDSVTVEFPTAVDRDSGKPTAFAEATSRVVECIWLPLEDRYESIRLGRKKANFVTAVAQVQKDVQAAIRKLR